MANLNIEKSIFEAATKLAATEAERIGNIPGCPKLKSEVSDLLELLRSALYPGVFDSFYMNNSFSRANAEHYLVRATAILREALEAVMPEGTDIDTLICKFIDSLPDIAEVLATDVTAAYLGDPAAINEAEIMLAYPSFEALSIFRIAHRLYELKVPLIPRIMTEFAHTTTGIDIHPGATIGRYFFIDHGTGVVIGETCTIGDHVKLYQGVTLGAKSFELDADGNPVKGVKRHPDIGNNVVIYAGATVLGGNTVVGDNAVIGGNVWLTHSVAPGESVYNGMK